MTDTVLALDQLAGLPPANARERALALAVAAEQRGDALDAALFRAAAAVGPDEALAARIAELIEDRRGRGDHHLAARASDLAATLETSELAAARWLISRAEALVQIDVAEADALIPRIRRAELAPADLARLELIEHELHLGRSPAPHIDLAVHLADMADEHPRLALRAAALSALDAWWQGDRRIGERLIGPIAAIPVAEGDDALAAQRDFALGVFAVMCERPSEGRLAASAEAARRALAGTSADPFLELLVLAVQVLMVKPGAVSAMLSRLAPGSEAAGLALRAIDAANRGEADACRELSASAIESGIRDGQPWAASLALSAHGRLELGLGNLDPALTMLQRVSDPGDLLGHPVTARLVAADRIEAAARSGRVDLAGAAVTELERWAGGEGDFSRAVVARFRALQAEPDRAAGLFEQAIAFAEGTAFEEGRTRLLYGEHLRRTRRRVLAREELRRARALFEKAGAAPWVQRAERELEATAETARRGAAHDPRRGSPAHLTPRERQVAELVAEGASNQEVAEQLIMSRKTVEHHLHNIYSRFGISSRAEVRDLLD